MLSLHAWFWVFDSSSFGEVEIEETSASAYTGSWHLHEQTRELAISGGNLWKAAFDEGHQGSTK